MYENKKKNYKNVEFSWRMPVETNIIEINIF